MKKMYMYHFAIWILKNVFQIDLENFADKTYSEFDKVEKELVDLKKQNDLLKRELESIKEKTDKNIQQEIDDLLHKVKIFQERVDSIDPRISVDDEDLDNAFVDKYGVKYSRDIKRLLKASEKLDYKNYQVPEGVVVICNSAFKDIDIESVILPKSIVEIGKEAFYSCFELKSINIPNGVTVINQDTFYCCSNLKTIDLPDSVESIGGNAFSNCSNLVSIVIPESVKEIGWEAFKDCTSLSSVKIPQSVNRVNYGAFNNTPWYNNQPDGIVYIGKVVYKYKGNMPNDTVINIKDGTTEISDGAFYGCTGLTSIVIPNSVDYIGWKAFGGCNSLRQILIPKGMRSKFEQLLPEFKEILQEVEEKLSTKVTEDDLENAWTDEYGVKYSADKKRLLKAPKSLKEYSILNGTIIICENAFQGCADLTSILIPNSVTCIRIGAFYGCNEIKRIQVASDNPIYDSRDDCNAVIETAKNKLFIGCKYTIIPDSIITIGYGAFYHCRGLVSINIPFGVTCIDSFAFCGCKDLASVTLPDSLTGIYSNAFLGCHHLKSITIPNAVTTICAGAFGNCDNLTSIIIPNSITSICNSNNSFGTFYNCESLSKITIPIGTRQKFEQLLPDYKDKLVEQ